MPLDQRALEQRLATLQAPLRNYIRKIATSPAQRDAVDDILQDTLSRAVQRLPSLRNEEKLKPWLFSIARNSLRTFSRRESARPEVESAAAHGEIALPSSFSYDDFDRMVTLLSGTDIDHQTLCFLAMRSAFNYSVKEISSVSGVRYRTVAARIDRAQKKIARLGFEPPNEQRALAITLHVVNQMWNFARLPPFGSRFRNSALAAEVLRYVKHLIARHPNQALPLYALSNITFRVAQWSEYADDYQPDTEIHEWRRELWNQQHLQDALDSYRACKQIGLPPSLSVIMDLTYLVFSPPPGQSIDWAAVRSVAETLIRRDPATHYHLLYADCLRFLEGAEASIRYLEPLRHNAALSDLSIYHRRMGKLHRLQGNHAKAKFYFQKCLNFSLSSAHKKQLRQLISECEMQKAAQVRDSK